MAVAHLVKRDLGGRLRALGSETRLAQNERQRHGEAGGVSGADQFLRVAAGLALEPAVETVAGTRPHAASLGTCAAKSPRWPRFSRSGLPPLPARTPSRGPTL